MSKVHEAPSGAGGAAVGAGQGTETAQNAPNPALNKGAVDSGVTEEELKKSLDRLDAIVGATPEGRKQALFAKGGKDGLTAEENAELMKLLSGETLDKSLKGGVAETLAPSDVLEKSLDVSPFIEHLNENLTKSMVQVAESVDKNGLRQQEHIVVLAKGLLDIGRLVQESVQLQKSMAQQFGVALRQPARNPRALGAGGGAQPLEKSLAGRDPAAQGVELSKAEVSDLISEMLQESLAKGKDGLSLGGFDINVEASQYEQTNAFSSRAFEAEVIAFAKNKRQRTNGHAR